MFAHPRCIGVRRLGGVLIFWISSLVLAQTPTFNISIPPLVPIGSPACVTITSNSLEGLYSRTDLVVSGNLVELFIGRSVAQNGMPFAPLTLCTILPAGAYQFVLTTSGYGLPFVYPPVLFVVGNPASIPALSSTALLLAILALAGTGLCFARRENPGP
jgi:hypothetical protein